MAANRQLIAVDHMFNCQTKASSDHSAEFSRSSLPVPSSAIPGMALLLPDASKYRSSGWMVQVWPDCSEGIANDCVGGHVVITPVLLIAAPLLTGRVVHQIQLRSPSS